MVDELSRKRLQRKKDREAVSEALDRKLDTQERVHHHPDGTLILCKDEAQHRLIHQQLDALEACGHSDWRRCQYCGKHDSPENLKLYGTFGRVYKWAYHTECRSKYRRSMYKLKETHGCSCSV